MIVRYILGYAYQPKQAGMTGSSNPSVLLFAAVGARGDATAAVLAEAGLAVTVVRDETSAVRAAAAERFSLAIVVAALPAAIDATESVKRLRQAHPSLEIMYMGELPLVPRARLDGFEARRIVGCVRERLAGKLDAAALDRARRSAEFAIAEARIGCLHQRAQAAEGAGARELAREIDNAIAQREALRRGAAGVAV